MENAPEIYLDYAATAPLLPQVAAAMEEARPSLWANPASLHAPGRRAFRALEEARARIARALGARQASEITITSGGTESDNAALLGITERVMGSRQGTSAHVIVSGIEHHAVLNSAEHLRSLGHRVTVLAPRPDGFIWPEDLEAAFTPQTVLVSVMAANNEVGTVQPISKLAAVAHAHHAYLHTDCVQMAGKLPLDLEASGVDAASFSAHKVGGPHELGVLYLRRGTPFSPLLRGGGQEAGRRSGTQDAVGALGMATAFELATRAVDAEAARLSNLRDRLLSGLLAASDRVKPAVDPAALGPCGADGTPLAGCGATVQDPHLPNIVCVTVDGMESETLLMRLDAAGIAASGGSACSSHSLDPSHVLTALGISRDRALGELRFSLGPATTEADVDAAVAALSAAVNR